MKHWKGISIIYVNIRHSYTFSTTLLIIQLILFSAGPSASGIGYFCATATLFMFRSRHRDNYLHKQQAGILRVTHTLLGLIQRLFQKGFDTLFQDVQCRQGRID